jgi:hypothetical protein
MILIYVWNLCFVFHIKGIHFHMQFQDRWKQYKSQIEYSSFISFSISLVDQERDQMNNWYSFLLSALYAWHWNDCIDVNILQFYYWFGILKKLFVLLFLRLFHLNNPNWMKINKWCGWFAKNWMNFIRRMKMLWK